MKKKRTFFLSLCLTIAILAIPFNARASEWEYKSDESVDRINGEWYMRTDCEDKPGDDCTTPGASTRISIDALTAILKLIRRLQNEEFESENKGLGYANPYFFYAWM